MNGTRESEVSNHIVASIVTIGTFNFDGPAARAHVRERERSSHYKESVNEVAVKK